MKCVHLAAGLCGLLLFCAADAAEGVTLLGGAADASAWKLIASDGVTATLSAAEQPDALRLAYDFRAGGGFCILQRQVELPLPENYEFQFEVRGPAPANNLEFKLVDTSGENVWWVNQRAFEPPAEWQTIRLRARRFSFAWGPSGGAPLKRLGAVEIAIAAAAGGSGEVWLRNVRFTPLPKPVRPSRPILLRASSHAAGQPPPAELAPDGRIDWTPAAADDEPSLELDFQELREFGGVAIEWHAPPLRLHCAAGQGGEWQVLADRCGATRRDYIAAPDGQAERLRLRFSPAAGGRAGVKSIRLLPIQAGDSPNALLEQIARDAPRGWYPRYFLGEAQPWTVVGIPDDDAEALLDAGGAVELRKSGPRIEPFLRIGGRTRGWESANPRHSLAEGCLPLPTVTWSPIENVELAVTAIADGGPGRARCAVRYRLRNLGRVAASGRLLLATRPFQVLPPWHELNITGGVAKSDLASSDPGVIFEQAPSAAGSWQVAGASLEPLFESGELPDDARSDPQAGLPTKVHAFDFSLDPGAQRDFWLSFPLRGEPVRNAPAGSAPVFAESAGDFDTRYARVQRAWRERVNRVKLLLPPAAGRMADSFRSQQAYILINADGPAIQPGSRTYERSWIRDGALTSTALLYSGHAERVRAFIDWYAPFQYDSGKVPCVVDRRGPDPVNEHDSTGELIYLLATYHRFTGDREILQRHFARVQRGVSYLQALRSERLTAEYRDGPDSKRVLYGLVPESISHEGYSAKPMHSYWDDFFVLRGFHDAAYIASQLGDATLAAQYRELEQDFRSTLAASIQLAMRSHRLDYIPGCAELGDFDATSTAIGLFPAGEFGSLPEQAWQGTFDRYWRFFEERRTGRLSWENYTPYEVRIMGALVRLGRAAQAHELLEFFLADQEPTGWNQWAEVVWRDPLTPRFVGDSPHTWVGGDYISAVRSMFVLDEDRSRTLRAGAGLPIEWLRTPAGAGIADFPTTYGALSYSLQADGDTLRVRWRATGEVPPEGFVICAPLGAKFDANRSGQAPLDGLRLEAHSVTLHALEADLALPLLRDERQ